MPLTFLRSFYPFVISELRSHSLHGRWETLSSDNSRQFANFEDSIVSWLRTFDTMKFFYEITKRLKRSLIIRRRMYEYFAFCCLSTNNSRSKVVESFLQLFTKLLDRFYKRSLEKCKWFLKTRNVEYRGRNLWRKSTILVDFSRWFQATKRSMKGELICQRHVADYEFIAHEG